MEQEEVLTIPEDGSCRDPTQEMIPEDDTEEEERVPQTKEASEKIM